MEVKSMRINHNISALNSWRSINSTNTGMGKTLERLSSGLKINRAGDDAAGLAISEKMRGQIKGLEMAVKNAQDAISLIQTAEGALTEVHSILQRMRELAVQASSDTNTNVDRNQIQAELDQLREEIDRIARTTEFNTMKLLDGKIEGFRAQADVKVVTGGNFDLKISDTLKAGTLVGEYGTISHGLTKQITLDKLGINIGALSVKVSTKTITIYDGSTAIKSITISTDGVNNYVRTVNVGDLKFEFNVTDTHSGSTVELGINSVRISLATSKTLAFQDVREGSYVVEVGQFQGNATGELDVRINYINNSGIAAQPIVDFEVGAAIYGDANAQLISTTTKGFSLSFTNPAKGVLFTWSTDVYNINSFGGALPIEEIVDSGVVRAEERWYLDTSLVFQIGANEGHNMLAGLDDMRAAALGLTEQTLKVTDQNSAERTIMVVDAAIHKVSSARAALGAIQNRLEHTIANLGVAAENLTAAESRIRDADMAKEMMQFTKQQILLQSSMSMLAQANAQPQQVLQLMR